MLACRCGALRSLYAQLRRADLDAFYVVLGDDAVALFGADGVAGRGTTPQRPPLTPPHCRLCIRRLPTRPRARSRLRRLGDSDPLHANDTFAHACLGALPNPAFSLAVTFA